MDFLNGTLEQLSTLFMAQKSLIIVILTSAIGSGFGAWFGARAILSREKRTVVQDIETTANITIAYLITLLGKLMNFKKDRAFPAQSEAETLGNVIANMTRGESDKNSVSIKLELWPELPFDFKLPNDKIFTYAGREPDVIQLLKMLDHNLCELSFLIRQRNALIVQMNAVQATKGTLPMDGLQLYLTYSESIARNTDENLFFIDKAIGKVRVAVCKLLPKSRWRNIADVGLRPETGPLMPPADYIKGWIK